MQSSKCLVDIAARSKQPKVQKGKVQSKLTQCKEYKVQSSKCLVEIAARSIQLTVQKGKVQSKLTQKMMIGQ